MRTATLSPLGLWRIDKTIFSTMVVPESVEKAELIKNILLKTSELEVLYTQPTLFRDAVGLWSRTRIESWKRMATALGKEYNPIENYDRYEETANSRTVTGAGESATTSAGADERAENGKIAEDRAGFNENDKLVHASETRNESTMNNSSTLNAKTIESNNIADNDTRVSHIHGNIGVTMASTMIEKELDIRKTDMYNIITNEFIKEFCLMVY